MKNKDIRNSNLRYVSKTKHWNCLHKKKQNLNNSSRLFLPQALDVIPLIGNKKSLALGPCLTALSSTNFNDVYNLLI